jgi:hypothetical protein
MTLIHTALLSEAQSIIETFKLKLVDKNPRIYANDNIILVVSGIGITNTQKALKQIFNTNNKITKAINIGIAGCSEHSVKIGELFVTNRSLDDINYMKLTTVLKPKINLATSNTLYDMEGNFFEDISLQYLNKKNIYIFKVVSDHLDDTILNKEFVKQLIKQNLKSIKKWI